MENTTQTLPGGSQPNRSNPKPKTGCLGSTMIIILVLIILLPIGIWMWRAYNRMVTKDELVTKQWANVENVYQKRMDLVQNLVNTVKGMADFEKSTLTAVIEARSKASSVNINAENLDEETFAKFQQAQDEFSGALSKLMVVMEQYPQLQAVEGFKNLMNDLKGIENEILAQRNAYNEVAMDYNRYIRTFPRNLFANIFGFEKKGYFKSTEGAENAPKVSFE
ncbi:LemA family protein [anaerobic digester metagenome]